MLQNSTAQAVHVQRDAKDRVILGTAKAVEASIGSFAGIIHGTCIGIHVYSIQVSHGPYFSIRLRVLQRTSG